MNERIKKLRENTLKAIPQLSTERAFLLTEFYSTNKDESLSVVKQRALAFKYILENKELYIGEDELIVGERGEKPKATPTYPEVTIHSLEDLSILNTREKISFKVTDDTLNLYKNKIIPFWIGKSIREKIFSEMTDEWKETYKAGIFTEFMEQRAPGHTVLDNKIYHKGFKDFVDDIQSSISKLDFINDEKAYDKREELEAMEICCQSLINYAKRYSEKLNILALSENDKNRKDELLKLSKICLKVPENRPDTFYEALQYYWFVHLGVITELNTWDSFNPGRLDQHLFQFYKKEIYEGSLTKEQAKELLMAFWAKFNNQPAPPKVGVTAEESSTYTDFSLINLGGVKEDGSDAVNELTYLILDVIEEMRLLQPSSMIQVSKKNPDSFINRALKIIKTGFGQPSVFNTDAIIQELLRQGKSIQDARNGGASGCVETGAFGKEAYILTGYFNLTKVLEITINNGLDPRTGKQIGLKTGEVESFNTYEQFFDAFRKQVEYFISVKIKGSNIIERIFAKYLPSPFLSVLIDDCIVKGMDYHEGGARYNTSYIQGVGIGTVTDSLSSIKFNVFENKVLSFAELKTHLINNFEGAEELRQIFLNRTPKYGNDDDRADNITRDVFELYYDAINGIKNTRKGFYRINLLPTTCHVYFGKVTLATPDGRGKFQPLSEGISPVQGADRNGPTSVIKSASKIDHLRTGGTLLNQKFIPSFFMNESSLKKMISLIRAYFYMDGHHIQFNVVDISTLRNAQKNPELYRDLIVRVAGYSDYFVDLSAELQEEIILRTEHSEFC